MTGDDEFVTIATFRYGYEAELARGLLESSEIDVLMVDEAAGRIANHLAPLLGWIKLQVRREDADAARDLLASVRSDPEL